MHEKVTVGEGTAVSADSLPDPDDILAEGPLHKVMVFFQRADAWPGGAVLLVAFLLAGLGAAPWRLSWPAPVGGGVILIGVFFLLLDTAVLRALPRRGLSFGPWKSQLIVLTVPRAAATAGLALAAAWLGWRWGLGLLLAVQLAATAALWWGTAVEPFRLTLSRLTVHTDRLPPNAPPIRLLHISDLHLERLTPREEAVLRLAREAAPDLVVITGDYVNLSYNKDPVTHTQVRRLLRQIDAPFGVYATLGSITVDLRDQVVPIFDELPIPLLRHHWRHLDLGDGRELVLLGMDCTHHLPTDRARLAQLHAAAPNSAPQILLYHSPELMPEASAHAIDLYLCGHTHGGQVRLPGIGALLTSSQLGRRYVMGLYREGRTHLYVSRGLGLEGLSAPRVRFLAPPEMTLVTIKPTNSSS